MNHLKHHNRHTETPSTAGKVANVIASPLTETPASFAILMFLDIIVLCYFIITFDQTSLNLNGKIFSTANLLLRGFLFAWIALFIYNLLSRLQSARFLSRIWIALVFVITGISAIIDTALLIIQHDCFKTGYCDILLQTNFNEASDFITTYLSWDIMSVIIALAIACTAIARLHLTFHKCRYAAPVILTLGIILCTSCDFYGNCDVIGKIRLLSTIERSVKLKMTSEQITHTGHKSAPRKIMLIIGESYARSHCSLYDYPICTTPRLNRLRNDSLLYVYQSVKSPDVSTIKSFKQIIGTWNDSKTNVKWHECPTIIEVAHKAGYRTYWLSNQSPRGCFSENQILNIANLADSTIFTTNTYNTYNTYYKRDITEYDGQLLPIIRQFANNPGSEFFIIHLMGSHFNYSDRYPSEFKPLNISHYTHIRGG